MMRKTIRIAMIFALLLIVGCSNKNIVTESGSPKEPLGETYGFTAFDVAIDTKEIKLAVTANYDEKRDKTEATYENQMEDLYLHGNKAMDKLNTIFEELSLEPDMDDEDIIKQTSEAFEVIDYKTLKLTVKFKGYDKKVLMMSK